MEFLLNLHHYQRNFLIVRRQGSFWLQGEWVTSRNTGFGEEPRSTLGSKSSLGAYKSKKREKKQLRKETTRIWCPSEPTACSFSALSDTPAKSYAPELRRPKGEYRVSHIFLWHDTLHGSKWFDIHYLAQSAQLFYQSLP